MLIAGVVFGTGVVRGQDAYDQAKQLFDAYAPPEVKAQVDFPTRDQFQQTLLQIQKAIQDGSLNDVAALEPQARALVPILRQAQGYEDYADWLEERLDEFEMAGKVQRTSPPPAVRPRPGQTPVPTLPYYDSWLTQVRLRPAPPNARMLMPRLEKAFAEEGVPPQLAWLAEAESSLNPAARSPAGAKGLFQLEPATAKSLGLSTFLPDERTDPDKSAHAAAKDLKALGHRFHSWPLALAAYNAGEGRVGRLLEAKHARSYDEIAAALPGETRMYVPKVCALIAARSGTPWFQLSRPK